jgi:hypothetical protein
MSVLDNTRIGEVFASLETRKPTPGTPEYDADVLQATRLVAAAYFLDVLSNALASVPREKRQEILGPTLSRFLMFLSLVAPALFANREEEQKTKAALSMALKDMRDLAAKRVQP